MLWLIEVQTVVQGLAKIQYWHMTHVVSQKPGNNSQKGLVMS